MRHKAFTLTELLVAIVVIGVLAAIVLPKFTKMLETRKTSEAEEMLAAVRAEQEARCMLDKPYFTDKNQLASKPKNEGSNFSYTLTNGGITATSLSGNYELRIPSYADGRICCTGAGCDKLDKDYLTCDDLTNKAKTPDYMPASEECAPGVTPPPPPVYEEESEEENCPEGQYMTGAGICCPDGYDFKKEMGCVKETGQCPQEYDDIKQDCVEGGQGGGKNHPGWAAGTLKDYPDCTCQCPQGYTFKPGAGCMSGQCAGKSETAIAIEKQTCEGGSKYATQGFPHNTSAKVVKGTYNQESCECTCPSGTQKVAGVGCVQSPCTGESANVEKNLCSSHPWGGGCSQASAEGRVGGTAWSYVACQCACNGAWKQKNVKGDVKNHRWNADGTLAVDGTYSGPSSNAAKGYSWENIRPHDYSTDIAYIKNNYCCISGATEANYNGKEGLEHDYDDDGWIYDPVVGTSTIEEWGRDNEYEGDEIQEWDWYWE